MITLALDLAGKTGYAIQYDTGHWKIGTWNLVRGELGGSRSPKPMIRLWNRLNRLAETHDIGHLIYEETFGRGAAKNRLDSLQNTALLFAMIHNISWSRVNPSMWKKDIVGRGTVPKAEYFAFAKAHWPDLPIRTDDEAAAVCLLEYATKHRSNS